MHNDKSLSVITELREKMDLYKKKLTEKYVWAKSKSQKMSLSIELINFSEVYKALFGYDTVFEWDDDLDLINRIVKSECLELNNFVNHIDNNNEFYLNLSNNVISNFTDLKYPFYKYYNHSVMLNPRLNTNTMLDIIFDFFKKFDYDTYVRLSEKMYNLEFLPIDLDYSYSGMVCNFPTIKKCFILLNNMFKDNIFKFETFVHEYGHVFEIQMSLDSNNSDLGAKALATPFSEVVSSFFEYAFLNYLKENKIYSNFVNQCLDNYFKEILCNFYHINLISNDSDLEIDEEGFVSFEDNKFVVIGDGIKEKLNYYEFPNYTEKINFRYPYIYGIGSLLSIYLYENYKDNSNFLDEFKKSLLNYPYINDMSAFKNLGISEETLLKGDVFKKVLKKYVDEG